MLKKKSPPSRAWRAAVLAAACAAAGLAHAGPTDLGTGPGTYSFSDNHDSAWFVTLDPGTYILNSAVTSDGFDLTDVWFSTSKDHKCCHANDIADFKMFSPTDWAQSVPTLTLTETTQVYVDVDTHLGRKTDGHFDGTFVVAAVPVPEPASGMLLLAGLGAMALVAGRRRRA